MTKLEALAKDCIENHTHRLIDKPTKQDIYLREESIFIQGYRQSEKKIAELEKENETLSQNLDDAMSIENCLKKRNEVLEKENAELVQENNNLVTVIEKSKSWGISPLNGLIIKNLDDQLTKAKDILTKILQRIPDFKANSIKDLSLLNALCEAEQFINGEGCPDCFCEDCTKDCEIKKLGLVEVEK